MFDTARSSRLLEVLVRRLLERGSRRTSGTLSRKGGAISMSRGASADLASAAQLDEINQFVDDKVGAEGRRPAPVRILR